MNQFKIMHIVWYNLLLILHFSGWKVVENPDYLQKCRIQLENWTCYQRPLKNSWADATSSQVPTLASLTKVSLYKSQVGFFTLSSIKRVTSDKIYLWMTNGKGRSRSTIHRSITRDSFDRRVKSEANLTFIERLWTSESDANVGTYMRRSCIYP